jgi:hypothetical protein
MFIFLIFQFNYFFILILIFPFLYDYYAQIYFIPYLFYFYFYYFIFSLVILRFTLLFIIRLFGLLPFPVIAGFHTIFSHYSHPAPRAALGHTKTGFRTGIRETTYRVSPPPPPSRCFDYLFF